MSISANFPNGEKVRVLITACDPSQRLIHAQMQDRGSISVAVFEIPTAFRWPKVGEVWTVTRQNLYWILGCRVNEDSQEVFPVTKLTNDEARIDSVTIYNAHGKELPVYNQTLVTSGDVLVWTTASGWSPINLHAYIKQVMAE